MREANHYARLPLTQSGKWWGQAEGQVTKGLMNCTKEFGFYPKGGRESQKGSEQERTE